ncbi:hypothetical protein [Amycolatopsis methanolica]|uniref:hypothetical protein n=1 Tax=Amycolatopsis methanolica TaxID=1814 RepID=UPI0012E0B6CC|nr:hypothetical protein [Amycolatopsis methanolica]
MGGPTHPMHIHLAEFQILTRRAYPLDAAAKAAGEVRSGLEGHVPGPGRRGSASTPGHLMGAVTEVTGRRRPWVRGAAGCRVSTRCGRRRRRSSCR